MYNLSNDSPSAMYLQATRDLVNFGDEVKPRGKLVAELRPACIEFENPYNRVTFLEGRRINPFFQFQVFYFRFYFSRSRLIFKQVKHRAQHIRKISSVYLINNEQDFLLLVFLSILDGSI